MQRCRRSRCRMVLNHYRDPGRWTSESGNALLNCVGRCSQVHSDDEYGPIFLRSSLQLDTYANSTALRAALLQWCYSSRNFGANPTASSGNGTGADDDRMQVDSFKKVRERAKVKTNTSEEIARPARPTRAPQTSTRARTVANLDIGRKTAGIPVKERMTTPPSEILAKARVNTQAKGKANTWTLSKENNLRHLKQPQPCRILRKIRVSLENSRAFQALTRGSWVRQSIPCYPQGDKRVPSICFLTVEHSFTPVQSRIQDKSYRCLILESTQQVEQDSNITEDDW